MTLLETIIYSLVFGTLSFIICYLSVTASYKKNRKHDKRHQFSSPIEFDLKNGVDDTSLCANGGSNIDGKNAVSQYNIKEK